MSAYMIAICEITNPNEGLKRYSQKSAELTAQYGGTYKVRGMAGEHIEGDFLKGRLLIMSEFPSMDKLLEFYNCDEYQEAKKDREGTGNYEIAFFDGLPPA